MQEGDDAKRKLPPTPDYHSLSVNIKPTTRSRAETKCDCQICVIGRLNGAEYLEYEKKMAIKIGRTRSKPETPPSKKLPLCSKCLGMMSRGVAHVCDKKNKRENLAQFVRTSSGTTKDKVTSDVLKSLCEQKGEKSGVVKLATGGATH